MKNRALPEASLRNPVSINSLETCRAFDRHSRFRYGVQLLEMSAKRKNGSNARHGPAFAATETFGLLLIAFLLLALTVIRYRHAIHWSVR